VAPMKVGVLASGEGSLLQAFLDDETDAYEIVGVISDRPGVKALARAGGAGVPAVVHDFKSFPDRDAFSLAVATTLTGWGVDLVASAGFGRILSTPFFETVGAPYLNSHPALLPSFPGPHGVRDALAYGVKVTGTTIIFADESTDGGPVIAQEAVIVEDDDSEDTLHARIKAVEQRLYPEVLRAFAEGRISVEGRIVRIR
jgi:phosphoribosylglycinamide formyltransferase 1